MNIFTEDLYDYLVLSLKASYEAVRKQSYEILQLYPNDLPFLTIKKIQNQFEAALNNSKSLIIKIYESSAYLMSILFNKHQNMIASLNSFEKKDDYSFDLLEFLVSYLEKEFTDFQVNFLSDWDKLHQNNPHGILTILSQLIENVFSSNYLKLLQKDQMLQKKYIDLFSRAMEILGNVMIFATKISAENVSTSLFDNSITKEKLMKEKSKKKLFVLFFKKSL